MAKLKERGEMVNRLRTELEEKSFRLALLLELAKAINSMSDMPEILRLILNATEVTTRAKAVSVALINKQEQLSLVAGRGFDNLDTAKRLFDTEYKNTPVWNAYMNGKPFLGDSEHIIVEISPIIVTAVFPLITQTRVIGTINIHKAPLLNQEAVEFLEILGSHAALALQNMANLKRVKAAAKSFEEKAHKDNLTRLYSRLLMEERFPEELSRAKSNESPLTLVMCEIDNFKIFNDSHSQSFGDIVLRETARILREVIRLHDIPIRFGSEEFMVILPDTNIEMGTMAAERIRRAVEAYKFVDPVKETEAKVTLSFGVAEWDRKGSVQDLINQADTALYRAKETGRNRVVQYSKGMKKK